MTREEVYKWVKDESLVTNLLYGELMNEENNNFELLIDRKEAEGILETLYQFKKLYEETYLTNLKKNYIIDMENELRNIILGLILIFLLVCSCIIYNGTSWI